VRRFGDQREGLGAGAYQDAVELGRALVGAARDDSRQAVLGAFDFGFDPPRVLDAAPHADRRDGREQRRREAGRGYRERRSRVECEEDPARECANADGQRDALEHSLRDTVERRGGERNPRDDEGDREGDLEDVDLVHGVHRRWRTRRAVPSETLAAASASRTVSRSLRTVPSCRRAIRTGVDSTRCAYESSAA
jgi:hypothetical protein